MQESRAMNMREAREKPHITYLSDKGSGEVNEDTFFLGVGERRIAVFDGTGGLGSYRDEDGKTGGYLASHIAEQRFATGQGSLRELAIEANKDIGHIMRERGIDDTNRAQLWGSTMVAAQVEGENLEWAQIGDSLIMLIYRDGSHKVLVEDYDHDKEILTEWKRRVEDGEANVGDTMYEKSAHMWSGANREFGVLNGDENIEPFLRSGTEPLENVAHVLLFTDGLLIPKEDPAAPDDFSLLTKLYLEGGLPNVKNYIRQLEGSDPECRKFVRYKPSDDMTAVALTVPDKLNGAAAKKRETGRSYARQDLAGRKALKEANLLAGERPGEREAQEKNFVAALFFTEESQKSLTNLVEKVEAITKKYGIELIKSGSEYSLHSTIQNGRYPSESAAERQRVYDAMFTEPDIVAHAEAIKGISIEYKYLLMDQVGVTLNCVDIPPFVQPLREVVVKRAGEHGAEAALRKNFLHITLVRFLHVPEMPEKNRLSLERELTQLRHTLSANPLLLQVNHLGYRLPTHPIR